MQFEKKLYKMSLVETYLYFTLMFILFNGFFFIVSLFEGKPRFFAYEGSWILQIVFPVAYSLIQTAINRNGVLKITESEDSSLLAEKTAIYLAGRGYVGSKTGAQTSYYVKKSVLGKMFSVFFRENISVLVSDKELIIYAKKNIIDSLLMQFKYKPNNN